MPTFGYLTQGASTATLSDYIAGGHYAPYSKWDCSRVLTVTIIDHAKVDEKV